MAIAGLTLIGETINDSVPSTRKLFEAGDLAGIVELARFQDEKGAAYIDVNVGARPPEFMADVVRRIQEVTAKPLSIDTPDPAIAKAGLAAYDPARAGGRKPLLNSISPLRVGMFDLLSVQPFRPILLISERVEDGRSRPCQTAEQTYQAATFLLAEAQRAGLEPDDCILDPGIAPIGSDTEGNLKRLIGAMEMLHNDPKFARVHRSVGLSNFTVQLPSKRADGSPVKGPLENAFLTKAMPLGLDMIIGSVKRVYETLPPEHPAMQCLEDCLRLGGFEAILRVREFYR
ncbi:MAG: dihydropteroate synthase [Thermoguttaceae bacterium]|jgi:5-methyltetrahydrofolate--homocysteine methyltransferase|nr:dihydropteroate synthase [Thermoguttaceae bacterium]